VSIVDTPDWANKAAPIGNSQFLIDTEFAGSEAIVTMIGGVSEQAHPTVTAFDVDVSGRLIPIYPNLSSGIVAVGTSSTPVITGTACYLHSMDVISNVGSAESGHIEANGDVIAAWVESTPGTRTVDLQMYSTIFNVVAIASGSGFSVVVRYSPL
jgi:hypothetical protein